jgi:hypothetical protein
MTLFRLGSRDVETDALIVMVCFLDELGMPQPVQDVHFV